MTNLALTWQQAALVTAGLSAAAVAMYRFAPSGGPVHDRLAPIARESGVIAGLYALWQLAGTLSVLGTSGAFSRARWIVRVEHDWHLPSEASVQRSVIHHPLIVQAANLYYASMHFGVMFVFLFWLFLRHRDRYGAIRNVLAVTTLICLLIQLIPVAPPRLLTDHGFVDTAQQYGQSVYSGGLAPDQLSAMPSVHVAWAVLVGAAVIMVSTSRWRWLALAHPIATIWVITATANHFWMDGIVATAVLAVVAAGELGLSRAVAAWRLRRALTVPEGELAEAPA